jgi:4-alpha-glucanotransferase
MENENNRLKRGLLCHITSLPNPDGPGTLGPEAFRFIDQLQALGLTHWQILPFSPTTIGDSPYMSTCSYAGNPNFISLDILLEQHLINKTEYKAYSLHKVTKEELIKKIASHYAGMALTQFVQKNQSWLVPYALFESIKASKGYETLAKFPPKLTYKENREKLLKTYAEDVKYYYLAQYLFDKQFRAVRDYAHSKGITIIGDIPMYVAPDSSDVWSNPDAFLLGLRYKPTVVAGVPPDYFSAEGQLWGNPLYNWENLQKNNFKFILDRLNRHLEYVDLLRIDHFIGFIRYFAIPNGQKPAKGSYFAACHEAFFRELRILVLKGQVIAEDLGVLTSEIDRIIDDLRIPRMKVYEFMYQDQNIPNLWADQERAVCYSGTHDNDTVVGWYTTLTPEEKQKLAVRLGETKPKAANYMVSKFLHQILSIRSYATILPIQDVLLLPTKYRMNTPGTLGNWLFQLTKTQLAALPEAWEKILHFGETPAQSV